MTANARGGGGESGGGGEGKRENTLAPSLRSRARSAGLRRKSKTSVEYRLHSFEHIVIVGSYLPRWRRIFAAR